MPGGTGDGDTADIELWVNGEKETTFEDLTGSWVLYTHTVSLSGDDQVDVVHTNAECSTGTRSLYVDWVDVDTQNVEMEGGSVVVDEGSGNDAFDGLDVDDPVPRLGSAPGERGAALRGGGERPGAVLC